MKSEMDFMIDTDMSDCNIIEFTDLPVEIQVKIFREYDKSLWIISRSLNKAIRNASYYQFLKNEVKYPQGLEEVLKLIPESSRDKWCLFKRYKNNKNINDYCSFAFYLLHYNQLNTKDIVITESTNYNYIYKDEPSLPVHIFKIYKEKDPNHPWWYNGDTQIDHDYITYLHIYVKRGCHIEDARKIILEKFDKDMTIVKYTSKETAIIITKLLAMYKIFDIKLDLWNNLVNYSNNRYVVPEERDINADIKTISQLAPIIRKRISNYQIN